MSKCVVEHNDVVGLVMTREEMVALRVLLDSSGLFPHAIRAYSKEEDEVATNIEKHEKTYWVIFDNLFAEGQFKDG